jgi:peptidoglycan/xylan/chitin deacetylase (PgdA/CDA1 family)
MPGNGPWRDRVAARLARFAGTRGAILCFHGLEVGACASPSSMHVSLERFEAVVAGVRGVATLVPLQEIVTRHLAGRSTAGLVALTADDAYASWLAAESLLAEHGIPLTLFAVGQALETGPTFWWDRIDDTAAWCHPERWRRFEDECGLPEDYRRGHPASEGTTRALRQWVLAVHAGRWPPALEVSLVGLEDEVGRRTSQRAMTAQELAGFVARTGAQVGVHTHSHAALPFLPDQEILSELRRGHDMLLGRFPEALPYLAIPFGLFDSRTMRLAAEAGMVASFTLEGHPLDRPFAAELGIPRLCVVREQGPGILALKASAVARLVGRIRGETNPPFPVLPSAVA